MIVGRTSFFLALFVLISTPFFISKLLWLYHSKKTKGVMAFEGMGSAGDQIKLSYSVIYFNLEKDTVWFNGMGNFHFPPGQIIPIRYQAGNPMDAKVDVFVSIWGDTLVYSGIPLLMLLFAFLHREVMPRRSKLKLTLKKPFIRIV